jgi:hypothetical protein
MDFSTLTDDIAAAAHRCWCRHMLSSGWRQGDRVDPALKIHDALRPYEELSAFDRAVLRDQVESEELDSALARAAEYALLERELSAADLRQGMAVRLAGGDAAEVGRVISWDARDTATGRLRSITVEWPDGQRAEYFPAERLLVPVEER